LLQKIYSLFVFIAVPFCPLKQPVFVHPTEIDFSRIFVDVHVVGYLLNRRAVITLILNIVEQGIDAPDRPVQTD
jgi:hypothetical protein